MKHCSVGNTLQKMLDEFELKLRKLIKPTSGGQGHSSGNSRGPRGAWQRIWQTVIDRIDNSHVRKLDKRRKQLDRQRF